jgi:hypothetical protein
MSTATSTHHRLSDPLATAAAIAVIVAGASVIGVAAFQGDSTEPTAPAAPVHGKGAYHHPARIGQGDFTRTDPGAGSTPALKGGHVVAGQP